MFSKKISKKSEVVRKYVLQVYVIFYYCVRFLVLLNWEFKFSSFSSVILLLVYTESVVLIVYSCFFFDVYVLLNILFYSHYLSHKVLSLPLIFT